MSELRWTPPPPPDRLRSALRAALGRRGRPLRVLAEGIEGLSGSVDWVTADPAGRVVAVLLTLEEDRALELVARGLAERDALAARLAEWRQLAPELGLRADAGVDVLLLAPEFSPAARAAAAALGDAVELARVRFAAVGAAPAQALLESLAEQPGEPAVATPRPRLSIFRSGLRDADLFPDSRSA